MKEYPENTPKMFIDYHQSNLPSKEIIEKFIFDERLQAILSPLANRIEKKKENKEYQLSILFLLMEKIREGMNGPSEWESKIPKEQEEKTNKIKTLLCDLGGEIKNTPYNSSVGGVLFNQSEWKDIARLMIHDSSNRNTDNVTELERSSLLIFEKIINTKIIDFINSFVDYEIYDVNKGIIKRKINVERLYFIRILSNFFMQTFKMPLYNITAEIASCFLDEQITIDSVRSALKK